MIYASAIAQQVGEAVYAVLTRNLHLMMIHNQWPAIMKRPIQDLSVDEWLEFLRVVVYFEAHGEFPK